MKSSTKLVTTFLFACFALDNVANTAAFVLVPRPMSTNLPPSSSSPVWHCHPNSFKTERAISSMRTSLNALIPGIELSDLFYDSTATAKEAWEWTSNIGAPAALVAGAVLVTLTESRGATVPKASDDKRLRFLKLAMRFLLLSSFGLEVVSIFVSTMTGSVLLGHGQQSVAKNLVGYTSPLQLLHHHHEFEYLTTQVCFLQGLFNWLAAVAIEMVLPSGKETPSARKMNKCLAQWLISLMIWMLAFYNHHLSFYSDYFTMLKRFGFLFAQRYLFERPIRPLSFFYIPSFLYSLRLTWKAFRSPPELDEE